MSHDDFKEKVRNKLIVNCESICQKLLPQGKKVGLNWIVGNIKGDTGESLKVKLDKGLWYDHAEGRGGDMFSLWAENKGISFVQALHEAALFFGISNIERVKRKELPNPYPKSDISSMRGTPVMEHLSTRGILEPTLVKYKVRTHFRKSKFNEHFIAYQYETHDGKPAFLKSTGINRSSKGQKDIWSTDPYYVLWGWWLVKPHHREIIITEGEEDAMSFDQMLPKDLDIPVLSLPNGATNLHWIDNDYEALQQFDKVYLCLDNDMAGSSASESLAKRLGLSKCYRVVLPEGYKDANEVLKNAPNSLKNASEWLQSSKTYDPPNLKRGSDITQDTLKMREERRGQMELEKSFLDIPFIQLPKEITILQGYPFHGKSDVSYQFALSDISKGKSILFVSLEIPVTQINEAMCQQWAGKFPTDKDIEEFSDWHNGKLYLLDDEQGKVTWETLRLDMDYAVKRFGVSSVFIDSLHFLVRKGDFEGQDQIVRELSSFALANAIHITLIAHSTFREGGEYKMPGIDSVEGSKGMVKVVHNLLCLWRNTRKEEVLNEETDVDLETRRKYRKQPDAYLKCWKQRNGYRKRFNQGLWYDFESRTYRTDEDEDPTPLKESQPF